MILNIKKLVQNNLFQVLCYYKKIKKNDITNNLIIAGSPRSGTTWLAEIFSDILDKPILWEPLANGAIPEVDK